MVNFRQSECPGCANVVRYPQVWIRPVDGRLWHLTCYEKAGK